MTKFRTLLSVFFVLTLISPAQVSPEAPRGVYGMNGASDGFAWTFRHQDDGGFVVTSKISVPLPKEEEEQFVEEFGFAKDWKPVSYSGSYTTLSTGSAVETLRCSAQLHTVSCDMDHEGTKSHAEIQLEKPFVVVPVGYARDFAWYIAGICSRADRQIGKTTSFVEIEIAGDPETGMKLKQGDVAEISYTGSERFTTPVGSFEADRFKFGEVDIWVARSGLVLGLRTGKSTRFDLASINDTGKRLLLKDPNPK